MEKIKQDIVEEIKKNGQIMDINLARFFDEHPWLFHDKIKSSQLSANYKFWGIIKGTSQYAELEQGPNPYYNMGLSIIDPKSEACMLTKESIVNDLKEIFPQYRNQIDELIEQL